MESLESDTDEKRASLLSILSKVHYLITNSLKLVPVYNSNNKVVHASQTSCTHGVPRIHDTVYSLIIIILNLTIRACCAH